MVALWNAGSDFLLAVLEFFKNFSGSYGVAIILLTICVRILLHPLTHKQMVSMQKMQKLQPRIKMLQEKYKNDKEKMNKEMMSLYRENKVNPAAGCLPLLVQLPILILLFRVLINLDLQGAALLGVNLDKSVYTAVGHAVGLAGETIGFGAVLSGVAANPLGLLQFNLYGGNVVLIIVIGFLTWYQQQMSATANPQMAFMNWFMPLFLVFICLGLPGGVLLYWGVSSFMGVAQQWWIKRKTQEEMMEENKPTLHKEKPVKTSEE
ncbi:MAG: YidC/Oxa1 family membrane protein insertase [Synergistales bacterium]|nr:YidC/Oxa1 family membrane protein insertase [Synergistales bacterium]